MFPWETDYTGYMNYIDAVEWFFVAVILATLAVIYFWPTIFRHSWKIANTPKKIMVVRIRSYLVLSVLLFIVGQYAPQTPAVSVFLLISLWAASTAYSINARQGDLEKPPQYGIEWLWEESAKAQGASSGLSKPVLL